MGCAAARPDIESENEEYFYKRESSSESHQKCQRNRKKRQSDGAQEKEIDEIQSNAGWFYVEQVTFFFEFRTVSFKLSFFLLFF